MLFLTEASLNGTCSTENVQQDKNYHVPEVTFLPNSRAIMLQSTPLAGDKKFLCLSGKIKDGHGVYF